MLGNKIPEYTRRYAWIKSQGKKYSGAGGSRTLVQTGKPYAFYTLILAFGFRMPARPKPPTDTLAPELHP